MKESTVHSLVIARTLLERAEPLCNSEDKYLASAGLIVLQDALEVVFYALLIELGVDDAKNLERKSFDDLLGELKTAGVHVPKSGTLKALNKMRVLTKHYAQAAEPTTVRTYLAAARTAIEAMTRTVIGRSIQDLFIADILATGEAKDYLKAAEKAISAEYFLDALIETRKAVFVTFEEDYNIFGWRNRDGKTQENFLADLLRGGWRAPTWTRNKEWIEKNVHVPTDYIQIDFQTWRLEAMELGIHTVELDNLRRLTPAVFRSESKAAWSVTYDSSFPTNNATDANARYCLDRAVSIVLKKQEHAGVRREPTKNVSFDPPPVYIDRVVFEKPSTRSGQVHVVAKGYTYTIKRIVGGFDPSERFYELLAESEEESKTTLLGGPAHYVTGFLQILPENDSPAP